jgi:hypothetical protein
MRRAKLIPACAAALALAAVVAAPAPSALGPYPSLGKKCGVRR